MPMLRLNHFAVPPRSEPPAALELPEAVWKPMGKGYENFPQFFRQYCSRSAEDNPDLEASLIAFCVPEAQHIIQSVTARPRCLIQGIACPYNGTALYRHLTRAGVIEPTIHAIDIMDVAAIAR